ncbi:hypothetical protein CP532_7049 [Ophiocordyceps camponoti-leonardi (nom. inval.)]|nr:hypothetical protein CP532_7049 [Ophiocordyceps camponoti-leonardi (nom. inval.)]
MSLYHEAAEILSTAQSQGGSLKSLVFGSKKKKTVKSQPNQLYALVVETTKWSPVLKEVIEASELLKHERKLTPVLSLLLVHDLLLTKRGISLAQNHGLRTSVERHKNRLKSELTRARLRRRASSLDDLTAQVDEAAAGEETAFPRWVRINSLISSVEEQLETTFASYSRAMSVADVVSKADRHIYIDSHVPNLVAVTPGIDLTKTEAYSSGKLILQDKASCFPAYLLDPRSEDGDVIDACAAPGNKTSHLASIIETHRPALPSERQTIFAFEKDVKRAQTLDERMREAGCKQVTRIGFAQDFLLVDPHSDKYSNVGALLLDPSCSGSGIIGRDSMPQLFLPGTLPKAVTSKKRKRRDGDIGTTGPDNKKMKVVRDDEGNETVIKSDRDLGERLKALSSFQLTLLLHALRFPAAKKVTYSTCSIYAEENERVVMEALKSDVARARGWRILARERQVRGMREWPVRGLEKECGGDAEVADGCIRCYKDDGRGTMGFFVAAFCRDGDGGEEAGSDGPGPYVRDEHGRIVRNVLGMPTLVKVTDEGGEGGGEEDEEEEEEEVDRGKEEEKAKEKEKVGCDAGSQAAGPDGDSDSSDPDEDGDDGYDDDDDEWGGFGD